LIVGAYAHVGQTDLGAPRLVKADGHAVMGGQLPLIR
jgi:hypothetical protein